MTYNQIDNNIDLLNPPQKLQKINQRLLFPKAPGHWQKVALQRTYEITQFVSLQYNVLHRSLVY